MTHKEFLYWLNGYLQMAEPEEINKKQIDLIKQNIWRAKDSEKIVPTKVEFDEEED